MKISVPGCIVVLTIWLAMPGPAWAKPDSLHYLAGLGDHQTMAARLKAGASPEVTDWHARTPLHIAAKYGQAEVAQLLISAGANIEATTRDDRTPLHYAATYGSNAVIEQLVAAGADLYRTNSAGETALELARAGGHRATVKLLLAATETAPPSLVPLMLLADGFRITAGGSDSCRSLASQLPVM